MPWPQATAARGGLASFRRGGAFVPISSQHTLGSLPSEATLQVNGEKSPADGTLSNCGVGVDVGYRLKKAFVTTSSPRTHAPLMPTASSQFQRVASTVMPSARGDMHVVAFRSPIGDILAAVSGVGDGRRVPVRVHDACLTGEVFGSLKCDCGPQLQLSLEVQAKSRFGVVIYMPQEGRGIGLANKIAAYQLQESLGLDTVDANLVLGLPAECRDYTSVHAVLKDLGVKSVMLMTNNPFKMQQLRASGVVVEGTMPVIVPSTSLATTRYLETKRVRMGHMLPTALESSAPEPSAPEPSAAVPPGASPSEAVNGVAALPSPAGDLLGELRAEIAMHKEREWPFTVLSFATSMDGFIAGARPLQSGGFESYPVQLSGEASALMTHHLRGAVDAILVGIGTVQADDPRLDVRAVGAGPSPRPVVLDTHLRLLPSCRLLSHEAVGGRSPTIVLCAGEGVDGEDVEFTARRAALEAAGAVVIRCREGHGGRVCLKDAWRQLGAAGVRSVMVEGGAEVISSLLAQDAPAIVSRVVVTQSAKILGSGVPWAPGGRGASHLLDARAILVGEDVVFTGRPVAASQTRQQHLA